MKPYRFTAVALLVLTGLMGCRSSNAILDQLDAEVAAFPATPLCAEHAEVAVIDERADVDEAEMQMPKLFYSPKDSKTVRPPITPEWEALIRQEVQQRLVPGSIPYSVTVRVVEGEQEFDAGWTSAYQAIRWRVEVELEAPQHLASAQGDRQVFRESSTSAGDFMSKMTTKALRNAVASTLIEAIEQIPSSEAGCATEAVHMNTQGGP